jgi:tetratricopeptide (TPR) repeat protein
MKMRGWITSLVIATLVVIVGNLAAQDSATMIRDLFEAAAYEEALAEIDRLPWVNPRSIDPRATELLTYRALCLLALARTEAAEEAVEDLFVKDPLYRPDAQASPRWIEAVDHVRSKVAPALVRSRYATAKRHFDQQEFLLATDDFEIVLTFLDNPALESSVVQSLSDIRTLSQGFLDLSRSATAMKVRAVPAAVARGTPPVVLTGWIEQFTRFSIYTSADPDITEPVTVRQDLPPWLTKVRGHFEGQLHVVISEAGDVESVVLRQPIHPLYNRTLLEAAKNWKYEPARKNGARVKFREILKVTVGPD